MLGSSMEGTHNERAQGPILDHLCADQSSCKECPERCRDETSVDGREHHECCRALLDERACRKELQWKGEEVQAQEYPEFIFA